MPNVAMNGSHLHLARYLLSIALPLLLIGAAVGAHLDAIRERSEQVRTALFIAALATSAFAALATFIDRHAISPADATAHSTPGARPRR